jgi:hypothetical protein
MSGGACTAGVPSTGGLNTTGISHISFFCISDNPRMAGTDWDDFSMSIGGLGLGAFFFFL